MVVVEPLPEGRRHKTIIVGCGPAGLAIAGRLRRLGERFVVLERDSRIAGSWHRHYERLLLHTVKETSHLPHRPFPASFPRYVPRQQLVDYYLDYARAMQIEPYLSVEVASIEKERGDWLTTTTGGEVWRSRHLVLCTGFNRKPVVPHWPGQERFDGSVEHSRSYRSAMPYKDRRVLVVGMGNTGAEIALDLWEQGAQPSISIRGPVNIVPRDILGRPTQLTAMMLARLPSGVGDAIGSILRRVTVGDLTRWGIATPELPPTGQLRATGKTPVIDVGTLQQIKLGTIQVRPGVERFEPDGVRFADGRQERFNDVILATGYVPAVGDFLTDTDGLLNDLGHPAVVSPEGRHRGLHLLGFDAYSVGGLLNSIRHESSGVAEAIASGP